MRQLLQRTIVTALLLWQFAAANAQFMPPGGSNEYPYPAAPPPPPVSTTSNTSCYSLPGGWPGTPGCLLLVSSWEGPGATGFAWQAVDAATWTIYDQGYYLYPAGAGITDLNVGLIYAGPWNIQINVSYHRAGAGHFVDIWDWRTPTIWGGPGGTVINNTRQLSCIPNHTRISMDSHKSYGTAIVWEHPGVGIEAIAANNNNYGPTFTFAGTNNQVWPDVCFTHTPFSGPPEMHIVGFEPGVGIHEYYQDWGAMIPGGAFAMMCPSTPCAPCPIPVTNEDFNPIMTQPLNLHIDAPDHYNVRNWTYTYNSGTDIYARVMNYNPGAWPAPSFGGIAATVCFTDGSYSGALYPPGLPPINGSVNDVPVVAYDHSIAGFGGYGIYVAWHTSFIDPMYNPSSNAYVAIELNEDGTIRFPLMPNSFFGVSNNPNNISPTPSIALSMCNDITPFLYGVFSESSAGAFWMQNRWIPWNAGVFKQATTATHMDVDQPKEISINPNPFKDDLHLNIPESIEGETIAVRITDMAGREVGSYNRGAFGVNGYLHNIAGTMAPGNYIISVDCKKTNFQKTFKVVKVD